MKNSYRIVEARSERLGTEWCLVRQISDLWNDVEEVSRHATRAEAEAAMAHREHPASAADL
jgi:hypothetical protein